MLVSPLILKNQRSSGSSSESTTVVALGAVLGISLVLLAVVIVGWVGTCLIMIVKNRKEANRSAYNR